MKNQKLSVLIIFAFISILAPLLSSAEDDSLKETACNQFENTYKEYFQLLGKDETGKPKATEKNIPMAWDLIGLAENCLNERSVAYERISTYAVKILPDDEVEPGEIASQVMDLSKGRVIYDTGFFLRKPYAAAGFEENILFLPHTAILGKVDLVTRHELTHARAHSLLLNEDRRLRHLWIFAEDKIYLDEIIAYAEGAVDQGNAEKMRSWSLNMAHQFINSTTKFIQSPNAKFALSQKGAQCPVPAMLKQEINNMLSCVTNAIESENTRPEEIALCDLPREQKLVCSP